FGKGLVQCEAVLGEQIRDQIERLKWALWHGQVDKALGKIDDLKTSSAPFEETYARFPRLIKALAELRTSIVHNRHVIPDDGARISSATVGRGSTRSGISSSVRNGRASGSPPVCGAITRWPRLETSSLRAGTANRQAPRT